MTPSTLEKKERKIRKATKKDAVQLLKFFIKSEFLGGGDRDMFGWKDVLFYIKNDLVVIAEIEGVFAGALWMRVYPEYIHTQACAVEKKFRKLGVYKALSEYRTKYALSRKIFWLDTIIATENKRMLSIAKKQGYEQYGKFFALYKIIKKFK